MGFERDIPKPTPFFPLNSKVTNNIQMFKDQIIG